MYSQKIYKYLKCHLTGFILLFSIPGLIVASENTGVDQLIVKYRTDMQMKMRMGSKTFKARAEEAVSALTGNKVIYKRSMAKTTGAHVLKLPHNISVVQARAYAKQLAAQNPDIEYAEPDYRRYIQRTVPNDPELNQQWHLLAPEDFPGAANVVNAWDISKGSSDIVVAVLDEGMTDHEDLRPAFVGDSLAESGYDMVAEANDSGDGDGRDSNPANPGASEGSNQTSVWHGTHVGGIIAAQPDNGKFIAGVGWNTSLSAVRILSAAGGYLSDQVDGMLWAAGENVPGVPDNPHPAHVLNMSVGSDVDWDCSRTEQNAINMIRARGVSVVVAAGNLNKDVKAYAPGNCEGVITVAGVMPDGARAPYSNYGELIDIAAPGDKIHSTINAGSHAPAADSSGTESGTSQAAPQVAGVIALMLAANEHLLDNAVIKRGDLVTLLEDKLKHSARAFPVAIDGSAEARGCNENQEIACVCTTETCGAGLLDAQRALKAVTTKPQISLGEDREVTAESTVTLDVSNSKDDSFGGKIVRYHWEQIGESEVALENADQAIATFVAPAAAEQDLVLRFKITVTDDVGLQGSRQIAITVPGNGNSDDSGEEGGTSDDSGGGGSIPLSGLGVLMILLAFRLTTRRR
ncbi:MAG: S8 family serine peptidase [Thiolinea sp.]